ncbi:MAG: hypothetical protein CO102_00205, partial [Candidatus Brennerbacteria bacterium CG_4_9_14_3_um_filter_43_9]
DSGIAPGQKTRGLPRVRRLGAFLYIYLYTIFFYFSLQRAKKHGFTPVDECDITYTTPPLWEITKSAGALVNVYV